jgi:hypothetical protein
MSAADETDLRAAIEWLKSQAKRIPYGKVGIAVQTHSGSIVKIFRTIEESLLAPNENGGADSGIRG